MKGHLSRSTVTIQPAAMNIPSETCRVSSAWHREMVRLINEVRKDRFTLDTLFRADAALRRMEGGR